MGCPQEDTNACHTSMKDVREEIEANLRGNRFACERKVVRTEYAHPSKNDDFAVPR